MAEKNTTEIKKTKYIYRDLFSSDFFVKYEENGLEKVKLNSDLMSDEKEEKVFQKLNEESNSLYQLMNQSLSTSRNINSLNLLINPSKNNENKEENNDSEDLKNKKKDFEKIGEISDNYQRVIDVINSCIWRIISGKEKYEKISSEIKKLEEKIECLKKKKEILEYAWFLKKLRLNFVNKDLMQADDQLAICMKSLQSLDPLKQKSQEAQQLKGKIKYLEEKKKNLEYAWVFKKLRLNRIEKNLKKANDQLARYQADLERVTKLSHKLVQFHENKVFVDNISLNIQNNDLNTKTPIHKILSSKENAIKYIEKNPNSETHSGMVSTVYSVKDENGNEKFVKPGQIFLIVPDDPDDIENNIGLNQAIGMGYLNLCLIPGVMYYVDSASRQFIENFVADMLGFGEYFIHTEFAIDNSGKSVVMDKAPGTQASKAFLNNSTVLNLDTDIAFEFNEADENGEQKLVIKKAKVRDLINDSENNNLCENSTETTQETIMSALAIGIVDFICIQLDRHSGNFFIDENGKMIGIDNDAIGMLYYSTELTIEIMKVKVPFVTSQIKERIISLYNNKDILLNFLIGKMNIGMQGNKVILKIEKRIDMLYNYVNSEDCPILELKDKKNWNEDELNKATDYFVQAHNNFAKAGFSDSFTLHESNPMACAIYTNLRRVNLRHHLEISNLIINGLVAKRIEINELVKSVVQKIASDKIDSLMLQHQIRRNDAIRLVVNLIVKYNSYFTNYNEKIEDKVERKYIIICKKIDEQFKQKPLSFLRDAANQSRSQIYQEKH